MATTGLWPVKCRLKDVLDYADNPDKTTAQKYLDRDLYATLTYAGNDEKTDQQVYAADSQCIQRMVCSADLEENPCGLAEQAGSWRACFSDRSIRVQEG